MILNSSVYHLRILFFNLFIFTVFLLHGQRYNFRNYSLEEGLSQSEINCIFEDSRGYLWIGTSGGGLNRFDGKEFKSYEQKDGLCGQIINAIFEDSKKNLLIGTPYNELCEFDGESFQSFAPPKDLPGLSIGVVKSILKDDNGNTIIVKNNQVLLKQGDHYEILNPKNDAASTLEVICCKKDSRNIIWIGTSNGLLVLKNKTLIKVTDIPELQTTVTALTEDVFGNIWAVLNKEKLCKVRITGPSHYQVVASVIDTIDFPARTVISAIHFDQNNQLWIGSTNKGLFKYSNSILSNYDQEAGLPVENIKTIFEDRSGNLWFGTSGGGLVKFSSQAFTYFDNIDGLNQPDIFAINADKAGNIWIGTQLHGIYKFNGKTCENMTAQSGIGEVEVRCIYTDSHGNVWIGSSNGITIYDGKSFRKYQYKECTNVRAIYEDSRGNMWIGTRGKHAFMDNGKTLRHMISKDGLTNDNVYSFIEDKNGKLWIGTGNGIYIFSNGKIVRHLGHGLCNAYAGSMVKDMYGNIWVGTDNCVAYYNGDGFTSIGTKEGLASGTVYLLNTGQYGDIWVGTNKGLDKISLKDDGSIASIRNFGKAEGFKGIECNSRATCVDKQGNLWFGTVKGAIKFDPREEKLRKRETPQVHLTAVKLFYEERDMQSSCDSFSHWYKIPQNLALLYNKNHITFDFTAVSKTFPEDIKYSFMLEGFDLEWSPPTEIQSATYSNLPPGSYTFYVNALNKDGISSKNPGKISFTIHPPFWTTWWFIALCVIGLIGFIYLYNEYRKRKHILYLERLEKIIKQRTAEIIKQRDENEILLKEVHHRVKNNLQIINSLINIQSDYVADPRSAELFREIRNRIRTISLVHEKLYKSDDYGNINVKEYIHMLVENLIETYSMNKEIQLKLDLEVQHFNLNTIIPLGLLLNEVISNSFKYAFNEVEEGIIEITLHKSSIAEEYTLIIGDNGKGFDDKLFSSESTTLGLELVRILASQLNGTIEKIQKPGTYYILKFKPLKN
jgi:two-component sensor histidine kinase/ligand-binding sensor domain-containing protein